jgi:hypothetical protein
MIQTNGTGRSLLMLYRHAVDEQAASPAEVDVMGLLTGGMRDIRCDVCGEVMVWFTRGRAGAPPPAPPHLRESARNGEGSIIDIEKLS